MWSMRLRHKYFYLIIVVLTASVSSYFPGTIELSWDDSIDYCNQFSTTLASFYSVEEFNLMQTECKSVGKNCWIGLDNIDGEYQFHDGTPLEYGFDINGTPTTGLVPWAIGEPSNWRRKCIQLWKSSPQVKYLMDDTWCGGTEHIPLCNPRSNIDDTFGIIATTIFDYGSVNNTIHPVELRWIIIEVVDIAIQESHTQNCTSSIKDTTILNPDDSIEIAVYACNELTEQRLVSYFKHNLTADLVNSINDIYGLQITEDVFILEVDIISSVKIRSTTDVPLIMKKDHKHEDNVIELIIVLVVIAILIASLIGLYFYRKHKHGSKQHKINMIKTLEMTENESNTVIQEHSQNHRNSHSEDLFVEYKNEEVVTPQNTIGQNVDQERINQQMVTNDGKTAGSGDV